MAEPEGYRVPDVCKIIGISYRQLDYWARTGMLTPSVQEAGGSGTHRLYSFQDLVQLKVIKHLLDTGVSLQKIRQAIEFLRDRLNRQPHGTTLMSDGKRIYAADSPEEIVDLLQRGQGVFAIALDKVWEDLAGSLARTKQPGPAAFARAGGA